MAQLNVRIDAGLLAETRKRADEEDRGLGAIVSRALVLYLGRDTTHEAARDAPLGRLSDQKCRHPVTRRIGDRCADCGRRVR